MIHGTSSFLCKEGSSRVSPAGLIGLTVCPWVGLINVAYYFSITWNKQVQFTHPAPNRWQWGRNLGIGFVCAAFQLLVLFPYAFGNFFSKFECWWFSYFKMYLFSDITDRIIESLRLEKTCMITQDSLHPTPSMPTDRVLIQMLW